MKTALIAREPEHSPNMAANDAAILESIAMHLRAMGTETQQGSIQPGTDAVCSMSRTASTLEKLKELENSGITVINSPTAVRNCSRHEMMQLLQAAGIKQPHFTVIDEQTDLGGLQYPAWIKRAQGWSCHKNDVSYAADANEAHKSIEEMRSRGITGQIHCIHIEGDIIKFYGIGRRFFHYSYPDPEKSKFGLERLNGTPHRYRFSLDSMKEIVFAAAESLGLDVYGGDCIVDNSGDIYIIDMNDFPSFSAVREEAAREIAQHIIDKTNTTKR